MLLPFQGEMGCIFLLPRAPLRFALGYVQVAPSGRTDGIIPPIISTQQGTDGIIEPTISSQSNWFFRAKNDLSSYDSRG